MIDWSKKPLRAYTIEEARFIEQAYKSMTEVEIVAAMNQRFKPQRQQKQIRAFIRNHKLLSGRTGRFERGTVSWNKGRTKYMGANATSFKKGSVPANRKPLGSERICKKDGFILIKVAETNPYTGFSTRYKHKHVHVWEQENGPAPDGKVVSFIDGDKTNCDISNLELISRAELLYINRNKASDLPPQLKPTLRAVAKVAVKMHELTRNAGIESPHD